MPRFYAIKITNWEKYNPKRDQKTYTWVRLNNDIFTGPDLFGLRLAEKAVWIQILCEASKNNSPSVKINGAHIGHVLGISADEVDAAVAALEDLGMLTVARGSDPDSTRPRADATPGVHYTYERTDERDERTDETDEGVADVESAPELPDDQVAQLEAPGEDSEAPPEESELHWLAELWNEICGSISTVKSTSGGRLRHIRLRLRESPNREHWVQVFTRIQASPFCRGDNNRGWRANFDWVIKPDTQWRVLEGQYDGPAGGARAQTKAEQRSAYNAEMHRRILAGEV